MKVLFISFCNAVQDNLSNKEFTMFFTQSEFVFLNSLIHENVNLLTTIFDNIKAVEKDGKLNLHDLPQLINIIITIFRVFLLDKKIFDVPLNTIVKFIVDTLVHSNILQFPDNIVGDEVKGVVRTTLHILNTSVKLKKPKWIKSWKFW